MKTAWKTTINLYRCFYCDRTSKSRHHFRIDGRTGRLMCADCVDDGTE